MKALSDEALMQQIQQGNQTAFQQLVDRYLVTLHAFAQRFLGNANDAEDVVQEVFLKVWQRAETWQIDKAKLSTWLYQITHNNCIDWQRKSKLKTVELAAAEEIGMLDNDDLQQAETKQQVEQALQKLPERQKSALVLCYYQGMSYRDAADILQIKVAALESLLARGRRSLKKQLAANMAED